jgi:hypothetical protein
MDPSCEQPGPVQRAVPLRSGTAAVVYALGAVITTCMAIWFAVYLFHALTGELTLTDRPRGPEAADVPWKSEPGSFWLFVGMWLAAGCFSARAAVDCSRHALVFYRERRARSDSRTPQV